MRSSTDEPRGEFEIGDDLLAAARTVMAEFGADPGDEELRQLLVRLLYTQKELLPVWKERIITTDEYVNAVCANLVTFALIGQPFPHPRMQVPGSAATQALASALVRLALPVRSMSVELGYNVHRVAGSAGWRPPEWRTEPVDGGPQLELRLAEVERLGQAALGYADSVTLTMTGRGRMTVVLGGEEWMLLHEPEGFDAGTPLHSFGDPLREDRRVCWAGGYTELSARYFVPRTLAIQAVQRFVSSGTLDLRLAWTAVLPDVPGWEPARSFDDPPLATASLAVVEGGELGRLVLRGTPRGTTVTFEPAHRGNFLRAVRDGPSAEARHALEPRQVDRISDAFHHGGLDLRTAWAAVLGLGRTT